MSTQTMGCGFVSGITPVAVGGTTEDAITAIYVGAIAANATAGTELILQDANGNPLTTMALGITDTVITYQNGPVLAIDDCLILISNVPTPVYARLNQALVSGSLAVNVGYTL